jgi:hypothetical protein
LCPGIKESVIVRVLRFVVVIPAVFVAACNAASPVVASEAGMPEAGVPDDSGTDSAFVPCTAPLDQRPDGGTCVLRATGMVTDMADAGLANTIMTFCGPAQCYGSRSDEAGAFDIPVGDFIQTENYALHADGRPDHAVDYVRFAHAAPEVVSAIMRLPVLPPSTVSLPMDGASASTITVGDLSLVIADGTKFDLDIADFGTASGRIVRVAPVPLGIAPSHTALAKLDAVYALAPSGAKSSLKMGVVLANSAGLAPSVAVELLVLGDDYFSIPPNVGVFGVAALAHVSADGLTIQSDPGEGIQELTWLGVRRKGK